VIPLPPVVRRVRARWRRLRVDRAVTAVLGPRYRRSRDRIELDITWACNLRCFNCNRSCEQAPTGEQMSAAQVERFVDESLAVGQRWARIRILGGEPTLHPELDAILAALLRYRAAVPGVVLELVTHGHGERTRAVLARLPAGIAVEDTAKSSNVQPFEGFNLAPVDDPRYARADYRNGCVIPEVCGIGLGPYGYYPCAVAAGIDRVLGLDLGRQALPADEDTMEDQLRALCARCGHFRREVAAPVDRPVASPSWTAAYAAWRARRPRLTRYGEDG
jgi:hypothetical protein